MAKKCTRCQQVKDKFQKRARAKDGLSSWCTDCWSDYGLERRKSESYRASIRAYQKKRESIIQADPELIQQEREVRAAREREKLRLLRENDPQGWRDYLDNANRRHQERWATDPTYRAKQISISQNRKALKYQGGSFTEQEWLDLCARYGDLCLCCKEQKLLTVDHVQPLSKGGLNTIDNIQPLCGSCNSRKRDRYIDYRTA